MKNYNDLLDLLGFGKHNALKIPEIQKLSADQSEPAKFRSRVVLLAKEARQNGNKLISDESGYYKAINEAEWENYKEKRLSLFTEELQTFAHIERI